MTGNAGNQQIPSKQPDRSVETSDSRPITVSWIIGGGGAAGPPASCSDAPCVWAHGMMGLCFCPGKQHVRGGRCLARSLDLDLARLKQKYGIQCVVCLLNDAELRVSLTTAIQMHFNTNPTTWQ